MTEKVPTYIKKRLEVMNVVSGVFGSQHEKLPLSCDI